MAAQAKTTKSTTAKNGSATSAVVDAVRDAGRQYLDTVEKTSGRVADFQEELGKASGTGLLAGLGRTQAGVTREVTGAYLRAARKIVG